MIVLGMDTSTSATAVALAVGDAPVREARDDPPAGAHPGHATRLLDLAGSLLATAGIGWGDVQRIAVGAGPGTFTGLRVGLATARGLAQSLGAELVSVSSTAALALPALAGGRRSAVLAAIDARRGEVFAALYGPGPVVLSAPRAVAPEQVAALARDGRAGLLAVGDGAVRYRAQMEREGLYVPAESSPLHLLRAEAVCALGAREGAVEDYQLVLPDYGRRPDAELALDRGGA